MFKKKRILFISKDFWQCCEKFWMKISQSFQKIQKSANAKISIVNTSKTHPQNEKKGSDSKGTVINSGELRKIVGSKNEREKLIR